VVAVNAHPDDEAILMGGTLAALADSGLRVVLVTLTRGEAGDANTTEPGARRMEELRASARALGAARVLDLGYADSGMGPGTLPPVSGRQRLHTVPVPHAASRLAALLRDQGAGLVLGYDAAGGYGHRDHVCVHRITRAAVALTPGVRLVEATAPREPILRLVRAAYRLRSLPGLCRCFAPEFTPKQWADSFTPSADITHRVDVREFMAAKRGALQAHASQAQAVDGGSSTMATVLALPARVSGLVLGREFFVEPGRIGAGPPRPQALQDLAAELV